jgi:3-oxoacyl-ACP reductase-like protein
MLRPEEEQSDVEKRSKPATSIKETNMSIFSSIVDKIFHHGAAQTGGTAPATAPAQAAPPSAAQPSSPAPEASAPAPAQAPQPAQQVDVGAVLSEMASMKGGGGNYQNSIVDLLKLLDLDSGIGARKELANELGVHAGADGSAEENIALHKAVMTKLAENGGIVPDSMKQG